MAAMITVALPSATGLNVLAGMHLGGGTQHRHQVAMPAHLDAQHREAGIGVMNRDVLNQARQGLALLGVWFQPVHRCGLAQARDNGPS